MTAALAIALTLCGFACGSRLARYETAPTAQNLALAVLASAACIILTVGAVVGVQFP